MKTTTQSVKLLIADDSQNIAVDITAYHAGFEILDICNNCNDLTQNPNMQQADIILINTHLPGLSCIEAAKRINFLNAQIPLVAITAQMNDLRLQDLVEAGFRGFIHKQDVKTTLSKVIKSVLNNEFVFPPNLKT